jgi:pyruvate-ferredoxin/flavodoxin oxidoreductase
MGLIAMSYGYVYTASCSMGYNRQQLLNAMLEAEAYDGPSIIMCYAPCINHGINMMMAQEEEKKAVDCGYFPVFRYNPAAADGKPRFSWDGPAQSNGAFQAFLDGEKRYVSLRNSPAKEQADALFKQCADDAERRNEIYKKLGEIM